MHPNCGEHLVCLLSIDVTGNKRFQDGRPRADRWQWLVMIYSNRNSAARRPKLEADAV